MTLNKQSLIKALELLIDEDCILDIKAYARTALSLANQLGEEIDKFDYHRVREWALSKPRKPANLAFTAGTNRNAAYLIEELIYSTPAAPIKLDENAGVDERQEFEKAFLEAHAAYCHGYGLDSIFERYSKSSAASAGEYCEYNVRSSWNMWQARSKLPVNPLTFLNDDNVVDEVAKATEDAAYSECFSTKEKKREWHRHIAKAAIATIKRLAQSKRTMKGNGDGL